MTGIAVRRTAADIRRAHRGITWAAGAALAASVALALGACSRPQAGGPAESAGLAARHSPPEHIRLIGKIDADMGAPGTFTGMDGWPAMAPADIHVKAGAVVVVTIKEYDDMVTALPRLSPFLKVMGGTEAVNGKRVTSVGNDEIAHTFTIPSLGINVPLPIAGMDDSMGSMGGPTTIRFTFRAPATPGTYRWLCVTPCGGDPDGVGGAMQTNDWMRGYLIVS